MRLTKSLRNISYIQPKPNYNDNIIVAMSGGVDSSVAASFYKDFPNIRGIYMANWKKDAKCNEEEYKVVQQVSKQLGIPCERVSFEREYWQLVFQPMIDQYQQGMTPNPDLNCNRFIKFGELINYLDKKFNNNKYWLVTGHYSRIMHKQDSPLIPELLRAKFKPKDQSYYLSSIPNSILSKVLLPIGHYTKPEVREIANDLNLINKDKPDSMGICFVNQEHKKFDAFLNEYIEPRPGNIVTEDGMVWGRHPGLWYGTIGQKSRITLPQGDPKYQGVWYISEKRYDTNELVIVKGGNNPKLFQNGLKLRDFISRVDLWQEPVEQLTLQYKSLQDPVGISKIIQDQDILVVETKQLQRAMAPGQYVVIYNGDRVIGTGTIQNTYVTKG